MIPVFKLAIISPDKEIVVSTWGNEKLELSLAEAVLAKLAPEAIGFFATRSQVENAISQAIYEVCLDLKRKSFEALRIGKANVIE